MAIEVEAHNKHCQWHTGGPPSGFYDSFSSQRAVHWQSLSVSPCWTLISQKYTVQMDRDVAECVEPYQGTD